MNSKRVFSLILSVDVLTTYFALVNSVSWNVFFYEGGFILAGLECNFKTESLAPVDLNLANSSEIHMPNLNAISWIQFFYEIVGLEFEQWLGVAKGGQFLQRAVFIWHIAGFSLLGLSLDHACRWSISIARIFLLK